MIAFAKLATVTASTKRNPATNLTTGLRGSPTTKIASLACTPLDPVTPEIAYRQGVESPYELLQTFVDADLDILEGDLFVVGSKEYKIRSVGEWDWRGAQYLHLILEEDKASKGQ